MSLVSLHAQGDGECRDAAVSSPFRSTVEAAAAVAAAEEIAAGSEADGRAHAPAGTPLATVPRGGSRPPL